MVGKRRSNRESLSAAHRNASLSIAIVPGTIAGLSRVTANGVLTSQLGQFWSVVIRLI